MSCVFGTLILHFPKIFSADLRSCGDRICNWSWFRGGHDFIRAHNERLETRGSSRRPGQMYRSRHSRYEAELKVLLALLLVCAGCLAQSNSSQATASPDAVDLATLKLLDRMVRVFHVRASQIWQGYDLSVRPFIVYRRDKWALLLNAPPQIEGFSPLPAGWPQMPNVQYHSGQYRDLVGQLEFDIPVGPGKAAAVAVSDLDLNGPAASARLMAGVVHENFHQYQNEFFAAADQLSEERYPITDRENTALAYIEMQLLRDALLAAQSGEAESVRALLRQFVAVRNTRWSRNAFVKSFESAEERVEGTAKYVEVKTLDLVQQGFGQGEAEEKVSGGYAQYAHPQYILSEFATRITGATVSPVDVPRNRLYPVGAALGMLLDYLGADWKREMTPDANASFVVLLSTALRISESSLPADLAAAKKRYGYDDAVKAADNLIRQHEDGFRAELRDFESQPGYRIAIKLASKNLQRSRTSSVRRWTIDDGRRSFCKHYEVYTLRSADVTLNLHDSGVLEERDWAANTRTVIFFVAEPPSVWLEGEQLQTLPSETKSFRSLKLSADMAQFQTGEPGQIRVVGHSITIDLVPNANP